MRRHLARATTATTFAAALLLTTACASDDDASSADDLAGVDEANQDPADDSDPAEPDTDSEAPDDAADRPEIELPDDMTNVFEDTETGDDTKDEIIADVIGRINAIDMGFAESDPEHEAVEFYSVEEALATARGFIDTSAEEGLSWSGTSTYYEFSVENEGNRESEPIVRYCNDIREMYTKELDTGEVQEKPDSADEFHFNEVVVRQNDVGVWQVFRVLPATEEGDQACAR